MSEVKQEKPKKEKKKLSSSAIVLIVGIIIIAIPVAIFVGILLVSASQTGTPRDGSRFDNDLNPAITESDISLLQSDIESLGSFDSVEIILSEGQLKIYIDTNDNATEEQVDTLLTSVYTKVNNRLPVTTYFSDTSTSKMYDLQISVYTTAEASEIGSANSRQYKLLHKNSYEEQYGIDDLAHPKDPSLAAELEGLTPTESSTDGTVEDDSDVDSSEQ